MIKDTFDLLAQLIEENLDMELVLKTLNFPLSFLDLIGESTATCAGENGSPGRAGG